jgi:phenylalanyl-tRNA synthetase alpha chain
MILQEQLAELGDRMRNALQDASDPAEIEAIRVAYLGRSGEITVIRRGIGALPHAERPEAGKIINAAVASLEDDLRAKEAAIAAQALAKSLDVAIDVTFPAPVVAMGSVHPIRAAMEDVCDYFERRGFAVVLGPEIESEYYNFDALNIPADHPAREGLDSFYLRGGALLRTHTSPMQVRTMQAHAPPIAIVVPGKAYRRDALDARHSPVFGQIEGLMVAPGIHLGHLKGVLTGLFRELFGAAQAVRFRPSFFPFTEPSAEVDTTCPGCGGGGCKTCGGSGWIEIGGSGMVHPAVLRESGYDPDAVQGWAFGVGIERIAMVRSGLDDIRVLYENDPRVLAALA